MNWQSPRTSRENGLRKGSTTLFCIDWAHKLGRLKPDAKVAQNSRQRHSSQQAMRNLDLIQIFHFPKNDSPSQGFSAGGMMPSRRSFASRSWLISATNSMSFLGSCSSAARAHSSIHRSFLSCITVRNYDG